jgi:hypothetical protein
MRRWAPWLLLASLALAALVSWRSWRLSAPSGAGAPPAAAVEKVEPAPPASDIGLEPAAGGLPIEPAAADAAVAAELRHPHPITPAHERLYRENNMLAALNRAVDLEDAARIRELVAQYRAEYPQDEHVLQEGYEIIAACLEQLDEATRLRAQRFWQTQIRSQTRRYVRRHCLDR